VSQELVRGRPIATQLTGLQLFPSEKRPRVIAMGLGTNESLARITEAVKHGVTVVGIPFDKTKILLLSPQSRIGRINITLFEAKSQGPILS